MRAGRTVAVAVAALLGLLATAAPAAADARRGEEVRLLVGFHPGRAVAAASVAGAGAAAGAVPALGVEVLSVPAERADAALAALRRSPAVAWVEHDHRVQAADTVPNDPLWSAQWGHAAMKAPRAWDTTVGSPTVTIAVVDSGVRATHPDLTGAVLPGWDFVNGDADADDDNGHGTSVAGVAAARGNNGLDIAGLCWTCAVLPVKALDADGVGWVSHISEGIVYAADRGAHVINLSLSSLVASDMLDAAVAHARSKGSLVVAAAGNAGTTQVNYPAGSPGVVGVAASTSTDARYDWSNHGDWVDVAAPGCQRTLKLTGTGDVCGTSLASPAVAGVAALLRAANPAASVEQLESTLTSTAAPVGYVSSGRVDAAAAVASAAVLAPPATAPDAPTNVTASAGDAGATVSWSAPGSDGGSAITGYTVTASPGGATTTAAADARSATVTGLTNGTAHTFTVQAENAVGTSPASAPSAAVTPTGRPAAPTNVRAIAAPAAATVRWDAPTDDGGSAVTAYTVVAMPGGRSVTTDGDARSATVEGLTNGSSYRFTVTAANAVGDGPASVESTGVTPRLDDVGRVAGASRVGTAVAVSQRAFAAADTVVIARADAYADALAAAPLATRHDAPVLLSPTSALPAEVRSEVARLGADTAILIGGTSALSPDVAAGLRAAGVTTVRRLAGQNRFDTARVIAEELGGTSVVVVEGANPDAARGWPDAVAASAYAASTSRPILLVTRAAVPTETSAALRALGATRAVVVGGRAAVPDDVAGDLGVPVTRIAGADRYATSLGVAEAAVRESGGGVERAWLATGRAWPDALSSGPAVAALGGVLLLVDGADVARSDLVLDWVAAHGAHLEEAVVVGGEASVSGAVRESLATRLA